MSDSGCRNETESEWECSDCGSTNTYKDDEHRLHCLDCGEIGDAYSQEFNPADEIDVDVRPFWRREKSLEDRYEADRVFTRMDAPAFISVEGLTVKFFSGPVTETEPEVTETDSPDEATASVEQSMEEFNDVHTVVSDV